MTGAEEVRGAVTVGDRAPRLVALEAAGRIIAHIRRSA